MYGLSNLLNPAINDLLVVGEQKDSQPNFSLINRDIKIFENMTIEQLREAKIECLKAIEEILKENSWLPRELILKDLKQQKLRVIIYFNVKDERSGWCIYYDDESNFDIFINYRPEFTAVEYRETLLNELDTYANYAANKQCGIKRTFPGNLYGAYLQKDGEIDEAFNSELLSKLNMGLEKVSNLQKIWRQGLAKSNPAERKLLSEFLIAVKHFKPPLKMVYPRDYERVIQDIPGRLKSGRYKLNNGLLESGDIWHKHDPRFFKLEYKQDYATFR